MLKFDQLYCTNELQTNDALLVFNIFLGYEGALGPKSL